MIPLSLQLNLSCLCPLVFLCSQRFLKVCGFPFFWEYTLKVIQESRLAHSIRYHVYMFNTVYLVIIYIFLIYTLLIYFMSCLRCLCLFECSGVRHILWCVFVLFFFVLCGLCCQFLWIVPFWLPNIVMPYAYRSKDLIRKHIYSHSVLLPFNDAWLWE
jgi:hypothetical protein